MKGTGIMGEPSTVTVDVQDMLCAQALAVVARAVEQLTIGDALHIRYNTNDVKQDLFAWANGFGHPAVEMGTGILRLEKRRRA